MLPLVEGVMIDYHPKKKNTTWDEVDADIFFFLW